MSRTNQYHQPEGKMAIIAQANGIQPADEVNQETHSRQRRNQGHVSTSGPSAREWAIAAVVALVAVGLTVIPYFLGTIFAREGSVFTGLLMNPEDSQTYFAKMLQGYDGKILYNIPFTYELHSGAFIGTFYVALGHLARITGISLATIWHLSRIAADLLLFLVTFGFVSAFLPRGRSRWTAYLLAIFGSGLGWVLFLLYQPYWLGSFPVDFKQPEAHLLFSALTFPHVALGTSLTMLNVLIFLRLSNQARSSRFPWRLVIACGLVNVALGIAYPFLIYLVAVVAVLYWLVLSWQSYRIRWRLAVELGATFVLPVPLYLYYAYTLQTNAVFRAWDAQAGTPALPWPHYLVAYGLMLLLAVIGWRGRTASGTKQTLLWAWITAAAVLLFAPLRPQRRFIQGVQVPLSILATSGFVGIILPRLQRSRPWQALTSRPRYSSNNLSRLAIAFFLAFMSLSNLYVLASVSVSAVVQQPDTLFRPDEEVRAVAWLRDNVDKTAVILSDYLSGNFIAAQAGQRVVLGHWAETVDFAEKEAAVAHFFNADTSDSWRRELLARYQVDYVWFSPRERELGQFDPAAADYLEPVHTERGITLYAVRR